MTDKIDLCCGDCLEVLASMPENSVDSCVTDPPYHLVSIVKRFGNPDSAPVKIKKIDGQGGSPFARGAKGFMGKQWDGGEIAFEPETWAAVLRVLKPGAHLAAFGAPKNFGFMQNAIAWGGFEVRDVIAWLFGSGFPKSHNLGNGWGTALKPAYEPIILARKPLIGTVAENVKRYGTGAINVDGCRIEATNGDEPAMWETPRGGIWKTDSDANAELLKNTKGRWPANVIHDGSEEVVAAFPESEVSGSAKNGRPALANPDRIGITDFDNKKGSGVLHNDSGSAARFFYTAKADSDDRIGSKHPTVKPLDLMQYLVRLITPKGGVVLDPFAGTGTTGEAAFREGMSAILIEREEEYQNDIRRRIALCMAGPDERRRETIKAKTAGKPIDNGPLFGGTDVPPPISNIPATNANSSSGRQR